MSKYVFLTRVAPAAVLAVGLSSGVALASPTDNYSCNSTTMTCTGSSDTGMQPTDLGSEANGPTSVDISQFDTQGGEYYLTGVTVTFTAIIASSGTISNNNGSSLTFTVGVDSLFSASAISSQLATLVSDINNAALDPTIKQVNGIIAANTSNQTFVPTSPYLSPKSTNTGPLNLTDLSDFENNGGGTLNADLLTDSTVSQSTTGGGGNLAVTTNLTTTAEGTLTYTYTYAQTPVPEPASLALLGSGLFGLGWVRRRRAAKRG